MSLSVPLRTGVGPYLALAWHTVGAQIGLADVVSPGPGSVLNRDCVLGTDVTQCQVLTTNPQVFTVLPHGCAEASVSCPGRQAQQIATMALLQPPGISVASTAGIPQPPLASLTVLGQ